MTDWTKERHATARKACEAATSGPWCIWDGPAYVGGGHDLCIGAPNEVWITNVESDERSSSGMKIAGMSMDPSEVTRQQRANAEFLATARTDLPAALDEIERLQELLRAEMEACDEYRETHDTLGCKPEHLVRTRSITGYTLVDSRCDLCKGVDTRRAEGG